MANQCRKSVRVYFKVDEPIDVLVDEMLASMAAGKASGRSGAAKNLVILGWLSACGYDPRSIVKRLRIPTDRSAQVFQSLMEGSVWPTSPESHKPPPCAEEVVPPAKSEGSSGVITPVEDPKGSSKSGFEQPEDHRAEPPSRKMGGLQLPQMGRQRRATKADLNE